jgi:hypothetical protein
MNEQQLLATLNAKWLELDVVENGNTRRIRVLAVDTQQPASATTRELQRPAQG